jgi:hypothetical protein
MFVMQPEIPVPLVAEFPVPAWATRPDERGLGPITEVSGGDDDPFALLPG